MPRTGRVGSMIVVAPFNTDVQPAAGPPSAAGTVHLSRLLYTSTSCPPVSAGCAGVQLAISVRLIEVNGISRRIAASFFGSDNAQPPTTLSIAQLALAERIAEMTSGSM